MDLLQETFFQNAAGAALLSGLLCAYLGVYIHLKRIVFIGIALSEVAALGELPPPPLPGRATGEAIAAGIGYGIRGAIARLVAEARQVLGGDPGVFLTGGWRGAVRGELSGVVEMADLVLAGIGLAALRLREEA